MITFLLSLTTLILGYIFYGRLMEKIFGINPSRSTPATILSDGVDYVPLNWWKIFLIQFLNIAGLGPIFGALLGAMFGPIAFLWIVFGNILGGAMHDFFSGMISVRMNGLSITEIIGTYLGKYSRWFISFFTLFLMLIVGAVFVSGPAKILHQMSGDSINLWLWIAIIFIYYFKPLCFQLIKL